jgi:hypothetical protein
VPEDAAAFRTSRHLADATGFDVLFHFAQNVIKLAAPNISLHLLVPFVIVPAVQPRRQLGALLERSCSIALLISARLKLSTLSPLDCSSK